MDSNLTARPAWAFITMSDERDVTGLIELLKRIEEDSDEAICRGGTIAFFASDVGASYTLTRCTRTTVV